MSRTIPTLRKNGNIAAVFDCGTKLLTQLPRPARHFYTRNFKADPWQRIMKEEGWIFIHIPKTAGQSLRRMLGSKSNWHSTIDQYFTFDPDLTERCFKFTVVRNPWDRIVSGFHYAKFHHDTPQAIAWRQRWLGDCDDFGDFISSLRSSRTRRMAVLNYHIFKPQTAFLTYRGRLAMDYVAKFESLPADIDQIFEHIGKPIPELVYKNASRRGDFRDYYRTKADVDLVGQLYAGDVEAFGYRYE